jgi:hypothetical protein
MLKNQNRIIIVDNVQEELEQLGKSFFVNGLGCRTFLYEQDYLEPLKNVRLAFFDVNLTQGNAEISTEDTIEEILEKNSKVFNDLAMAINQYISPNNGPFALIFWTKNSTLIDAFKRFMQIPERGFNDITAKPIFIGHLDKVSSTEENSTLSERVINLLNSDEKIKIFFDFEENARIAGEKTINRIYDILPKDQLWGDNTILYKNIDSVFSKISASTLGLEHAKENPQKALYEGLIPVLNYELINQESDIDWDILLKSLMDANHPKDITSPDSKIQNKVNSLFHIEDFVDQNKDVRGCVVEIDKTNEALLQTFNIDNIEEWVSKLIAIKEANAVQQARKVDILSNSKLIAVELSAACDYSNKKPRINKYIIGILTKDLSEKLDDDLNLKGRPESCYHLGGCCFNFNDSNIHIWLNLNYVFGAKADDVRLGSPLFILKKEIMDMVGNKYASHVSRIGITSF